MPAKNIAIKEEVYNKIAAIKRDDESFSDVIERLLERKPRLSAFAGVLAGTQEMETMREDIKRVRSITVTRK